MAVAPEADNAVLPQVCRHCGSRLGPGDPAPFCCGGCQGAHAVLVSCGLGDFHQLREGQAPFRPAVPIADDDWVDDATFRAAHERPLGDGLVALRWRVEGIHCAACVWLLERLPRIDPAIKSARLSLADDALDLVVDPTCCPPSRQRAVVASLGYRLRPLDPGTRPGADRREKRARVLRLAVAAGSALGAMHLSFNVLAGDLTGDLPAAERAFYGWTALVVATPGLTYGAASYWRGLLAAWRVRRVTIDALTALVIAIAVAAAVVANLRGTGDLYVDAAAMFVTLLSGSRLILSGVRERIQRRLGHGSALFGESARRLDDDDHEQVVAVDRLVVGDQVRLSPGGIVPVDGIVLSGDAQVSLAVLTGESRPVQLDAGEPAWAGSRCLAGTGVLRCTAVGATTRIGMLVQRARSAAVGGASSSESWVGWFAPVVLAVVAATALWWWWIDPARILDAVVAVILVSCPCALGIALPLAGAVVLARGEGCGVLVREPTALLRAATVRTAVVDKTGTLTEGAPTCVLWSADGPAPAIAWVLAVAARSAHPLAQALLTEAERRSLHAASGELHVTHHAGRGIEAMTPAGLVRVGSAAYVGITPGGVAAGSQVHASIDGRPVVHAVFADALQEGAGATIAWLRHQGVAVHIASGDRAPVVAAAAVELGIAASQVHAECLPEDKAALVQELRRHSPVVMIGDGVNDAAAMAAADLAIGLHGGLAACLDRCDVVVPAGRIAAVPAIIEAGTALRCTMRVCLALSLVYNVAGVAAVWAGWVGPIICAIAMPVSSLTVLLVALRCRAFTAVKV